ncbi:hypothetical protein FRC18_006052 [Serendipita sp. 400]|nr:hypothetical protein FRC18_006052 [Serendipita sp. 400]
MSSNANTTEIPQVLVNGVAAITQRDQIQSTSRATGMVSEASTTDVSRFLSFSRPYSTNIKWKARKTTKTKRIMDKRKMKKKLRMRIRPRTRKVTKKVEEPRVEIDHEAESNREAAYVHFIFVACNPGFQFA